MKIFKTMKKLQKKSVATIATIILVSIGIIILDVLLCIATFRGIDQCSAEQIVGKVVFLIILVTAATAFFGGLLYCIYNDKEN